jgi:hypothetical protein
MGIVVTAKALVNTNYNFTETELGTIRSDSESATKSRDYTYGSGNFKITGAVKQTGVLPSGGIVTINFNAVSKEFIEYSGTVGFSGVKNFTVVNESTVQGRDIAVRATGTGAFTNLFNGGSGNLLVKPYSCFTYNDPYGLRTSPTQRNIQLFDVSGSGAAYSLVILGDLA